MEIEGKVVTERTFELLVTETELLHLEAAMDCITDVDSDVAANYLGMYEKRYSSELACNMLSELQTQREKISG